MTEDTTLPARPLAALRFVAVDRTFPLKQTFRISRAAKTVAHVCNVILSEASGRVVGRGECVPYAHYGESVEGVLAELAKVWPKLVACIDGVDLADAIRNARIALSGELMGAGAARNALDCALWDAEAKLRHRSATALAGLDVLAPVATCVTLSIDTPDRMAQEAARQHSFTSLKLKLGGDGAEADIARLAAVRAARADAELIVDANEAWTEADLATLFAAAASHRVALIEQPLPAGNDDALSDMARPVPVCADEALHTATDLDALRPRYDAINIKLDKAGGLTHGLELASRAREAGFRIMVGSMVSSSLAIAPACLLAQQADWVDLDSPALLADDRDSALRIEDGMLQPPLSALWG